MGCRVPFWAARRVPFWAAPSTSVCWAGAKAVETGRIDRLRIQTAGEGMAIPRIWGQMRVPGHVIWASDLEEVARTENAGGGKGAPAPR